MRATSLEDVPFRLLLVATWAVAWGATTVLEAIRALAAGGGFGAYLFAFVAGVLGAVALSLAVLPFTETPFVRGASVVAFVGLAAVEALGVTFASPDPVAVAAVALHLAAAGVLVLTKEFFRPGGAGPPDESGCRVGV